MLLTEAHTSLNDVDDIVAKFLALVDDVHIDGTDGVSIFVVVHIGSSIIWWIWSYCFSMK